MIKKSRRKRVLLYLTIAASAGLSGGLLPLLASHGYTILEASLLSFFTLLTCIAAIVLLERLVLRDLDDVFWDSLDERLELIRDPTSAADGKSIQSSQQSLLEQTAQTAQQALEMSREAYYQWAYLGAFTGMIDRATLAASPIDKVAALAADYDRIREEGKDWREGWTLLDDPETLLPEELAELIGEGRSGMDRTQEQAAHLETIKQQNEEIAKRTSQILEKVNELEKKGRPLKTDRRRPRPDTLRSCQEAMKLWLSDDKPLSIACDTTGVDDQTLLSHIPDVLANVDPALRARWIKKIRLAGKDKYLREYSDAEII